MKIKKISKIKRKLIASILLINILCNFAFLINIAINIYNSNLNENDKINRYQIKPKITKYSPTLNAQGNKIKISLHESFLNTSLLQMNNLSSKNTFKVPCPTTKNFNSSNINISIKDIYAPNVTINIEDDYSYYHELATKRFASFTVLGNAILENISIKVRNKNVGSERYYINVYNATQSGSYIKYDKDLNGLDHLAYVDLLSDTSTSWVWINATNLNLQLNVNNTYNNTFFVAVSRDQSLGEWAFENQEDGDDTICWEEGGSTPYIDVDYNLKVSLAPLNNTPKPSDINLKINGTSVSNNGTNNSGYWTNSSEYYSPSGFLNFQFSADWYDIKLNVSNVQINYTKTDLTADSNFIIKGSGQDVLWNITRPGGLNYFEGRFSNYKINFTIPKKWNNINVFNGSVNKTGSITVRNRADSFKDIVVHNAG
ncbi:MAG: hypothetical protein ACTSVV_17475, partial [Promethearchaeota archaeon]